MLNVLTLEEALDLIKREFSLILRTEHVSLSKALGRILAEDIISKEYVPDFNRSTVDGYALRARDVFGCSDSIPAILTVQAQIRMGESAGFSLPEGCCAAIPTGGAVPAGADSIVMLEYAEDYGDGTIGVAKPVAPGENIIFRGDDVFPGKQVLPKGQIIRSQDVGALSAMGFTEIPVYCVPRVGIISTGDELVAPDQVPAPGQIRDVNSLLLAAQISTYGAVPISYGIVPDEEEQLKSAF